jgi:predicted nucleic acid-binding protein
MIAFDSKLLIYITGLICVEEDRAKHATMLALLAQLSGKVDLIAPVQALGEVYYVCQRKGMSREEARTAIEMLRKNFTVVPSTEWTLLEALDLATEHKLQFWDAMIFNAAADANCQLLLSEDMQPGFAWRGVEVINPLAAKMDHRLARMIEL